jgi:glycerol-3-phosphate dehydrogenase
MRPQLSTLSGTPFDLLVIGGGIHGACAAWDAVSRGLSVVLVEREDFGSGTSANSLKILHGGLRYLQSADLRRMRQSLRERATMMRLAPHLTRPLPVLVPTTSKPKESRTALWAALRASEAVAVGTGSPGGELGKWPAGRILDRRECLREFPWLETDHLTGGALWHDGQALNSERLTFSFLLSAAEAGAAIFNYAEAVRLLREKSHVAGARILDRIGGGETEIRARVVLNAAGPWWESVRALGAESGSSPAAPPLQALAINLISRRPPGSGAVGIRSRRSLDRDPVGGGGRYLFLAPWRGRTLIGTSYRPFTGAPGRGGATEADLRDLLDDCNEACPGLKLAWDDIVSYHAGVLPLRDGRHNGSGTPLASEPRILDHGKEEGGKEPLVGLISMIGVKYTTARRVAEKAIDQVFCLLGRTPPRCRTAETPLWGAESPISREVPVGVPAEAAGRLREVYGSRAEEVARRHGSTMDWAAPIAEGCAVLRCEIVRAVRDEMAVKLSDVVLRRTDLGTAECPPASHLAAAARIMGEELGWTPERRQQEIAELRKVYAPLSLPEAPA